MHLISIPGITFFPQIKAAILKPKQNAHAQRHNRSDWSVLYSNFVSVLVCVFFYTMAASTCISLVEQFDDIVAATDVLCAGIEGGKGIAPPADW